MANKKQKIFESDDLIKNKWLVRFERGKFDNCLGFVLDANEKLTLMNLFDFETAGVSGFTVFENKSVKGCEVYEDPNSFDTLLLKIKMVRPKEKPPVSIDSIAELLGTAGEIFPLIVIHREKIAPDTCWIGEIARIKEKSFLLRPIDPNAEWDEELMKISFKDVTRVEFGNGYENCLNLVAEYRARQKPR
jgi:hypothetical protein